MAIKKNKPSAAGLGRSLDRAATRPAGGSGTAATFRAEAPPRRKTTLEFDAEVFRALKRHGAEHDLTIRELVDRYCRAGLEADGISL